MKLKHYAIVISMSFIIGSPLLAIAETVAETAVPPAPAAPTAPSQPIQGTNADGLNQTTIVDENGNLKIVDKKNAPQTAAAAPETQNTVPATPAVPEGQTIAPPNAVQSQPDARSVPPLANEPSTDIKIPPGQEARPETQMPAPQQMPMNAPQNTQMQMPNNDNAIAH